MKQRSLARQSVFEKYGRKNRRELFLDEMEQIVPSCIPDASAGTVPTLIHQMWGKAIFQLTVTSDRVESEAKMLIVLEETVNPIWDCYILTIHRLNQASVQRLSISFMPTSWLVKSTISA